MATSPTLPLKTPSRFLFIASIGNPHPYRSTRHSAGHILLDALTPLLPPRFPFLTPTTKSPAFYKTWRSPSYMNESGPKLLRQLKPWLASLQSETVPAIQRGIVSAAENTLTHTHTHTQPEEWHLRGIDPRSIKSPAPTLVILHDELEAPLGKIRVKRGGPEAASLRGHRGLISIMESLRGKGLYPPQRGGGCALSVLRIGVGIGRPESRGRGDVADYVLTEMSAGELDAVRRAAGAVVDILADEIYRRE